MAIKTGEVTQFELWRQDESGNRFLVGTFGEQGAAEQRLAELTRSLHKQTYWIDERHPGGGDDGTA